MPSTSRQSVTIDVADAQPASALLQAPPDARACYVMAHGAGAGMNHAFMAAAADDLAAFGIATLRYQFPYMERGSRRPGSPKEARATVRAAVVEAARLLPGLTLVAGGKSYVGRADHLFDVEIPMLFLQGTRDKLAERQLLEPLIGRLEGSATLSLIEDADHSFHVPARSGRKDADVLREMLGVMADWIGGLS